MAFLLDTIPKMINRSVQFKDVSIEDHGLFFAFSFLLLLRIH